GAGSIVTAARDAGVALAVAENYKFFEPAYAARRLVDEGAIGDLLVVRTHRIAKVAGIWARDGWRTDAELGGGVVLDQVTHFTNLLRTLVGEIVEVHAWTSSRAPGWQAE